MSLPSWLVAVPKPHIHYARDHYWKYLIHILCFSASKGIHWSEMKLKQSTGLKPAKWKKPTYKHCMAASQWMLHHAVVSLLLWPWPKNPLNYGLWVGFLMLAICNSSDTQQGFLLLSHGAGCGLGSSFPRSSSSGARGQRLPGHLWNAAMGTPSTVGGLGIGEKKGLGFMSGIFQHQ